MNRGLAVYALKTCNGPFHSYDIVEWLSQAQNIDYKKNLKKPEKMQMIESWNLKKFVTDSQSCEHRIIKCDDVWCIIKVN